MPVRSSDVDYSTTFMPRCRPRGCAGLCTAEGMARTYRTHRLLLLGRARAVLRDRDLAEDAVQETFERAWRACATFDPAGPPVRSWLCVIGRNVALDMARCRARRPSTLVDRPERGARPATGRDEADAVLLRMELRAALHGLDAEHRRAVLETVVRDRPSTDLAAELGVPAGTVRSRTHYALRRLRAAVTVARAET